MFFHMALALITLTGHVLDKLTGQDLSGVTVSVPGAKVRPVTTNDDGLFKLRLPAGTYTIHLESNDVPPQEFTVKLRATQRTVAQDFKACSLTLDYHC